MSINNDFNQFISDYENLLKTPGNTKQKKSYHLAIKDLTQSQRKDFIAIIKGKLEASSPEGQSIAKSLNDHLTLQADNPGKQNLSIRHPARQKAWHKSIQRKFSNLGGRVSSEKISEKIIDKAEDYINFLKKSSKYHHNIEIKVIQSGLSDIPLWHLEQFASRINNSTQLRVIFLRDDLSDENGIDFGGLTREYLDDLMREVTNLPLFIDFQLSEALLGKLPKMDMRSEEEKKIFENIGTVMSFCYRSSNVMGRFFDDSLFKALFCLKPSEVNASFEDLKLETKVKLARHLLGNVDESAHDVNNFLDSLDLLSWKKGDETPDNRRLSNAAYALLNALPEHFLDDIGLPDMDKIKDNLPEFIKIFTENVFSTPADSLATLGGSSIDSLIAPVHSMAKGMKLHSTFVRSAIDFSNQIQGSLDRSKIVSSLVLNPDMNILSREVTEVTKKVDWLKDWLLGETIEDVEGATDIEVQQFVKLCTGSSGIPKNQNIRIGYEVSPSPFPTIHTCAYKIDISSKPSPPLSEYIEGQQNDHTRAAFIEAMKYAIENTQGFQIS